MACFGLCKFDRFRMIIASRDSKKSKKLKKFFHITLKIREHIL